MKTTRRLGEETPLISTCAPSWANRKTDYRGVYKLRDQTGQYKPSARSAPAGRQRSPGRYQYTDQNLMDSGWFTVIGTGERRQPAQRAEDHPLHPNGIQQR